MRIICISCPEGAPEIEEEDYTQHMQKQHPHGQISSIKAKKNVPVPANLPPGIKASDLPNQEFLKTIEEMEKSAKEKPQETSEKPMLANPVAVKPAEVKPIELTYKYEGACPTCNTPVNTIMVEVKGSTVAIAFCITHKQISSLEVTPIPKK